MKLVVFDVDGTLVNSQAMIVGAMGAAFEAVGLAAPQRSDILAVVGLSLPVVITRLLPDDRKGQVDEVIEAYRDSFASRRIEQEAPLYDGARACLDALGTRDDLLLAVATGKSRRGLDAMLDHHDLHGCFVTLQTADNHPSKPHPEMLLSACAEAGVAPKDSVMIGDTEFDMLMAASARTDAIGVCWGYHDAATLRAAGVDVASDYPELQRLIEEWAQ